MKKYILILVMSFVSGVSFSQEHKVTIYSTINITGRIDYLGFDKFLPDSLKSKIILDYNKIYKLNIADDVQNFVLAQMTLKDWKLVSATGHESFVYTLSREIILDDTAYKLYVDRLNNEFPKR